MSTAPTIKMGKKSGDGGLILASKSKHRAKILKNAGVKFKQIGSKLDERAIEDVGNKSPKKQAEILAVAKAKKVSEENQSTWVIGCDQILEFNGKVLHKPKNKKEAKRRLQELSGKNHYLHSAVVLVNNQKVGFVCVDTSIMTMRKLSPQYIEQYIKNAGDGVLSSVGAYQIENYGINLLQKIQGDFFSIIGLPIIPLLNALRKKKVIK